MNVFKNLSSCLFLSLDCSNHRINDFSMGFSSIKLISIRSRRWSLSEVCCSSLFALSNVVNRDTFAIIPLLRMWPPFSVLKQALFRRWFISIESYLKTSTRSGVFRSSCVESINCIWSISHRVSTAMFRISRKKSSPFKRKKGVISFWTLASIRVGFFKPVWNATAIVESCHRRKIRKFNYLIIKNICEHPLVTIWKRCGRDSKNSRSSTLNNQALTRCLQSLLDYR